MGICYSWIYIPRSYRTLSVARWKVVSALVWRSRSPYRPVVSRTWNGERQRDSRTVIRCCPEASPMALDDGPTDRQADPHAVGLGRVERLEEPIHLDRVEPHSDVFHAQPHVVVFASGGPDQHMSWSIVDAVHRL